MTHLGLKAWIGDPGGFFVEKPSPRKPQTRSLFIQRDPLKEEPKWPKEKNP